MIFELGESLSNSKQEAPWNTLHLYIYDKETCRFMPIGHLLFQEASKK